MLFLYSFHLRFGQFYFFNYFFLFRLVKRRLVTSSQDLYQVQTYLLLRLIQSNALRHGFIRNMTQRSKERANQDDKEAVVMVHKKYDYV